MTKILESEDEQAAVIKRVTFSQSYSVCIMAIDGTWRRDCLLNSISDIDAELTVEGSMEGLNLREFFMLLSATGLAYRRCELFRVQGSKMDVRFKRRPKQKPSRVAVRRSEGEIV